MVRSMRRRGIRRPELRIGLLLKARSLCESFPTTGFAEHIASLEVDPILLDSASMFTAHFHGIGPSAADPYVYARDPGNVRRWLLDENDILAELDPETHATG